MEAPEGADLAADHAVADSEEVTEVALAEDRVEADLAVRITADTTEVRADLIFTEAFSDLADITAEADVLAAYLVF